MLTENEGHVLQVGLPLCQIRHTLVWMSPKDKPLVWLHGEIKTPPFTKAARIEAGYLLRELQRGTVLTLPHSRPMPGIGPRCHELRIVDEGKIWRIIYRTDRDAIVIAEVFAKKTTKTQKVVLDVCQRRLREYDDA
jgi:phage-related protein